jgi:hypothetical protein
LYEFLIIEEDSQGVFLKFKHISPGYEEAEEQPITLELSELSNNRYVFKSQDERGDPNKIIYEFKDSTNLLVTVEGFEDGAPHSFNIKMKKAK